MDAASHQHMLHCWWPLLALLWVATLAKGADRQPNLTEAQRLLANGNERAALAELDALLRVEPDNLFALANAGLIHARRGHLARAADLLTRAHRLKPSDTQLSLALLEVQARLGQAEQTERITADLLQRRTLTGRQIRAAAQLLYRSGSYQAAEAMAKADPEDSAARHDLLGLIYTAVDNVRDASDEFQQAINLEPGDERRYFRLGMLYLKYRTPSLAVIVFRHGVERKPEAPLLWSGLGVSQCLDEKPVEAEASLLKAIELNPRFTDAYLLLGDILEQEKPREALEIFRRAITEHPELAVAYYYYGRLALLVNDEPLEHTISVLRKAVTLNPNFAEGHYELGRALEHAGQIDQAIEQFETCLKQNPKLYQADYRLSFLYRKRGDPVRAEAARTAFEQAQKPQDPSTEQKRLDYQIEVR